MYAVPCVQERKRIVRYLIRYNNIWMEVSNTKNCLVENNPMCNSTPSVIWGQPEQVNYGDCMPGSFEPNCGTPIVASFRATVT